MSGSEQPRRCVVLRSRRRPYTYLYLGEGFDFGKLPAQLRQAFGEPEPVMELELTPTRTLAQENPEQVLANLAERGWHLQLPPEEDPSGWLDLPKKS
jgi:uncharacterized protein YcgL (UPF0745 family)